MDFSPNWNKLKGYMEAQKALLKRFSQKNKALMAMVKKRDWVSLQQQMEELKDLSCRMEVIEDKRQLCFDAIIRDAGKDANTSLSEMLPYLPAPMDQEFRRLKADIKLSAERISIENRALDCYVEARNKTIQEIMGELVPETRGQLYGPKGDLKQSDIGTRSLLVNKSL
jgi:hypothetical protein